MFSNEYGEAAVEVLDILDNTNKSDVAKIPTSFIKFLVDNASEDYRVNLDHSKLISEMNLKEKTKEKEVIENGAGGECVSYFCADPEGRTCSSVRMHRAHCHRLRGRACKKIAVLSAEARGARMQRKHH